MNVGAMAIRRIAECSLPQLELLARVFKNSFGSIKPALPLSRRKAVAARVLQPIQNVASE